MRQVSAAEKVQSAFTRLTESRTLSGRLSLNATPAQLRAFTRLTGEPMPQQDAETLSGLSLSFTVAADKPLKDVPSLKSGGGAGGGPLGLDGDKALDVDYAVRAKDGAALMEVRQVDGRLYARADVRALAEMSGQDPAEVPGMEADLPPELGAFRQALEGQWLSVDDKVMRRFTDGLQQGQGDGLPSSRPSLDADAQRKLMDGLRSALSSDVSFEDKGQQNGAERIVVSAPARTLVRDLQKAVMPLAGSLPGLPKGLPDDASAKLTDRAVTADLLIKDGALSSVSVDLAQLNPKADWSDHLPLRLTFSREAAPIQAPSGVTVLTEKDIDLMSHLMSADPGVADGMGGPGGTDSGSGSFTSSGDGAPDGV